MHVPLATANVSNRGDRANQGVGVPLEDLFNGVDDLIKRVADSENPEIRKIRAKVRVSMLVAKSAFEGGAAHARRPAAHPGGVSDEFPGEYPGQALGVALLVGVGLGVIISIQP
jgi:ElaB/YqjD/DUF883 family membrane-anchored ribosome-binding protein